MKVIFVPNKNLYHVRAVTLCAFAVSLPCFPVIVDMRICTSVRSSMMHTVYKLYKMCTDIIYIFQEDLLECLLLKISIA